MHGRIIPAACFSAMLLHLQRNEDDVLAWHVGRYVGTEDGTGIEDVVLARASTMYMLT